MDGQQKERETNSSLSPYLVTSWFLCEFRNDNITVTDEVVVCGNDIVEEGDTIEADSAVDLIGSSHYSQP